MDLFEAASAKKCFTAEHKGFVFSFTRWTSNPGKDQRHEWIVSWKFSRNWSEHFTGWHCPMLFTEQEIVEKFAAEIFPKIWPPEWQRKEAGIAA